MDEIALERACRGEVLHLTRAERAEAVRRMRLAGLSVSQISHRLRISGEVCQAICARMDTTAAPAAAAGTEQVA